MDAREKIITAASALISESGGNIDAITMRAVAERAGVGAGLINYHFQTKENLIELCVQRSISAHISRFRPDVDDELNAASRLTAVYQQVADYLAENPSVSQISILGDMKSPGPMDNTMKTVMGLSMSLKDTALFENEKKLLVFTLAAALQALFLRRDLTAELFGFDFNDKPERDAMLDVIAHTFFDRNDTNL